MYPPHQHLPHQYPQQPAAPHGAYQPAPEMQPQPHWYPQAAYAPPMPQPYPPQYLHHHPYAQQTYMPQMAMPQAYAPPPLPPVQTVHVVHHAMPSFAMAQPPVAPVQHASPSADQHAMTQAQSAFDEIRGQLRAFASSLEAMRNARSA